MVYRDRLRWHSSLFHVKARRFITTIVNQSTYGNIRVSFDHLLYVGNSIQLYGNEKEAEAENVVGLHWTITWFGWFGHLCAQHLINGGAPLILTLGAQLHL